jgi:hypothetical protein
MRDVVIRAQYDHLGLGPGGHQALQYLPDRRAKRLDLDRDHVGPQPTDDIEQVGVGRGASSSHPQVHGRRQP